MAPPLPFYPNPVPRPSSSASEGSQAAGSRPASPLRHSRRHTCESTSTDVSITGDDDAWDVPISRGPAMVGVVGLGEMKRPDEAPLATPPSSALSQPQLESSTVPRSTVKRARSPSSPHSSASVSASSDEEDDGKPFEIFDARGRRIHLRSDLLAEIAKSQQAERAAKRRKRGTVVKKESMEGQRPAPLGASAQKMTEKAEDGNQQQQQEVVKEELKELREGSELRKRALELKLHQQKQLEEAEQARCERNTRQERERELQLQRKHELDAAASEEDMELDSDVEEENEVRTVKQNIERSTNELVLLRARLSQKLNAVPIVSASTTPPLHVQRSSITIEPATVGRIKAPAAVTVKSVEAAAAAPESAGAEESSVKPDCTSDKLEAPASRNGRRSRFDVAPSDAPASPDTTSGDSKSSRFDVAPAASPPATAASIIDPVVAGRLEAIKKKIARPAHNDDPLARMLGPGHTRNESDTGTYFALAGAAFATLPGKPTSESIAVAQSLAAAQSKAAAAAATATLPGKPVSTVPSRTASAPIVGLPSKPSVVMPSFVEAQAQQPMRNTALPPKPPQQTSPAATSAEPTRAALYSNGTFPPPPKPQKFPFVRPVKTAPAASQPAKLSNAVPPGPPPPAPAAAAATQALPTPAQQAAAAAAMAGSFPVLRQAPKTTSWVAERAAMAQASWAAGAAPAAVNGTEGGGMKRQEPPTKLDSPSRPAPPQRPSAQTSAASSPALSPPLQQQPQQEGPVATAPAYGASTRNNWGPPSSDATSPRPQPSSAATAQGVYGQAGRSFSYPQTSQAAAQQLSAPTPTRAVEEAYDPRSSGVTLQGLGFEQTWSQVQQKGQAQAQPQQPGQSQQQQKPQQPQRQASISNPSAARPHQASNPYAAYAATAANPYAAYAAPVPQRTPSSASASAVRSTPATSVVQSSPHPPTSAPAHGQAQYAPQQQQNSHGTSTSAPYHQQSPRSASAAPSYSPIPLSAPAAGVHEATSGANGTPSVMPSSSGEGAAYDTAAAAAAIVAQAQQAAWLNPVPATQKRAPRQRHRYRKAAHSPVASTHIQPHAHAQQPPARYAGPPPSDAAPVHQPQQNWSPTPPLHQPQPQQWGYEAQPHQPLSHTPVPPHPQAPAMSTGTGYGGVGVGMNGYVAGSIVPPPPQPPNTHQKWDYSAYTRPSR